MRGAKSLERDELGRKLRIFLTIFDLCCKKLNSPYQCPTCHVVGVDSFRLTESALVLRR